MNRNFKRDLEESDFMFSKSLPIVKVLILNIIFLGAAFGQKEPDYKLNKEGQAIPTFLGRIIMLKGTASRVEGNGKMVALKETSKIKKNQVIATGKGSFLKIKLINLKSSGSSRTSLNSGLENFFGATRLFTLKRLGFL